MIHVRDHHASNTIDNPLSPIPVRAAMPVVWIIVLNWNGGSDTVTCLGSLKSLTYTAKRLCVIDNGSTDDSLSLIRGAHPDVLLLETGHNLGYAGGNNVGIRYAMEHGADYILILNNDTIVAHDLIEEMLHAYEQDPRTGAVGAKIYDLARPNVIWQASAEWSEDRLRFISPRSGLVDNEADNRSVESTALVCGCALFTSTETLRKVGLLDDRYFLNYEESDWCYRARACGYTMVIANGAKLWHRVSASFGGDGSALHLYFMTRNRLMWIRRHVGVFIAIHQAARELLIVARSVFREINLFAPGSEMFAKRAFWRFLNMQRRLAHLIRDPYFQARFYGALHFAIGRTGDCPVELKRKLTSSSPRID